MGVIEVVKRATNNNLSTNQIQQQQQQEVKAKFQLALLTQLYAPALTPIKVHRELVIKDLINCYKKQPGITDDDIEIISHLDRAFPRDAFCRPYMSTDKISAIIREFTAYKDVVVRGGPIFLPQDRIIIQVGKSELTKTTVVSEVLLPCIIEFEAYISPPIKLEGIEVGIGGKKFKGAGKAILSVTPIQ